jgi:hypothetical protein
MQPTVELRHGPCTRSTKLHTLHTPRNIMPNMYPHRRTQTCRASTNQEENPATPSIVRWVPRKSQGVDDVIERKAPKLFDPFNKPNYDELDELPMTKILTGLFRQQVCFGRTRSIFPLTGVLLVAQGVYSLLRACSWSHKPLRIYSYGLRYKTWLV